MDMDIDHTDDWDKDLNKGGDKATEGYYPLDEEDEEKTWSRRYGRYWNYGPWNYRWGYNYYNNGGYLSHPNWYGGYPQPYPYGWGGKFGYWNNNWSQTPDDKSDRKKECKRNPDGTCKDDEAAASPAPEGEEGAAVQVDA